MITGFFLSVLYTLIAFFVAFLPVVDLPSSVASALQLFGGYANAYSFLWPIATYLQVIALGITFELSMLSFNLALKVYHMIRG